MTFDVTKLYFREHPNMLCLNCLERGGGDVEVGPEIGPQRDPERCSVSLCRTCRDALLTGAFDVLHKRFQADTTIGRGR